MDGPLPSLPHDQSDSFKTSCLTSLYEFNYLNGYYKAGPNWPYFAQVAIIRAGLKGLLMAFYDSLTRRFFWPNKGRPKRPCKGPKGIKIKNGI